MPDGQLRVLARGGQVEIFLHGDIFPGVAEQYARELDAAGNRPVLVRLHSPGGDWLEAAALFSATERYSGRTAVLVEGPAASSASFLVQAFTERKIASNALVMVHPPTLAMNGRAEDHATAVALLNTVRQRLAAAYSRSRQPSAVVDEWLAREHWFDAGEALAVGLVDAIDQPAALPASVDLSAFTNVPPRVLAALSRGSAAPLPRSAIMDATDTRPEDTTSAAVSDTTDAPTLAERRRFAAIRQSCEALNMGHLLGDYIERGVSVQAARDDLLARYAEKAGAATAGRPSISLGVDHSDPANIRNRMVSALVSRLAGTPVAEDGREFRSFRLVDMLRHLAAVRGEPVQRLSDSEIIIRAYGAHTTSDFPILTTESGSRVLLAAYKLAESPFKRVSREQQARDFRPLTQVRFGEAPQLLEVTESAPITHGTTAEAAESYALKTWGRIFALSRKALVNDDLEAFSTTLRWWGRAAAEAEAQAFLTMLALNSGAGPAMSDAQPLFHSTHGNVGTPAAPSVTSVAEARQKIREQKGLNGTAVGGTPKFLIVGPAKELAAQQVVAALYPAQTSNANPFTNGLEVLVEARLSGNSWFVFTDPSELTVLTHAYLEGAPGPQLASEQDFSSLDTRFRCHIDFNSGIADWRGAVRNAGG